MPAKYQVITAIGKTSLDVQLQDQHENGYRPIFFAQSESGVKLLGETQANVHYTAILEHV